MMFNKQQNIIVAVIGVAEGCVAQQCTVQGVGTVIYHWLEEEEEEGKKRKQIVLYGKTKEGKVSLSPLSTILKLLPHLLQRATLHNKTI